MLCRLWRGAAFVSLKHGNSNINIGLEAAKVTSEEVRARLVKQLAILREKDRKTKVIRGDVSRLRKKHGPDSIICILSLSRTEKLIFVITII
jgi:hypothetical protein